MIAVGGEQSPFVIDVRAIGLFRVLLALVVLLDQGMGLSGWHAHYSEAGILSPADSRDWLGPWYWSLYWLGEGPLVPIALDAVRLAATLTLLVGIRSRLSAAVLFLVLASFAVRNPLVVNGGDRVLIVMTFFGAFLPLGGAWSLGRLWHGGEPARTVRSAGTTAYVVQVLLVWFMAGIHKTAPEWWSDGTALSMALHIEAFVAELARLWRGYDPLVQPLTFFVLWLECLAPLLALVPLHACRVVGLGALVVLEVGIWASLEVGIFPLISRSCR